jgi:tetratricopeptide (TPR) repeat protein
MPKGTVAVIVEWILLGVSAVLMVACGLFVAAESSFLAVDRPLVERRAAAGWLAHAEGKNDEAVQLLRSAAELEDSTDKHPVTPGAILPARELLGDLLIELKQPAQALKEFEIVLQTAPNRFNSLFGAAHAAQLMGNQQKARTYYQKLVASCAYADNARPELQQAKKFLAKK